MPELPLFSLLEFLFVSARYSPSPTCLVILVISQSHGRPLLTAQGSLSTLERWELLVPDLAFQDPPIDERESLGGLVIGDKVTGSVDACERERTKLAVLARSRAFVLDAVPAAF